MSQPMQTDLRQWAEQILNDPGICPACDGIGEDYNFRCDHCGGRGRVSVKEHPLYEDTKEE